MAESSRMAGIKEGIMFCKNNAERLLRDAHILFENGKHVSSFLLSQLSLEEEAKAFRLVQKQLKGKTFSKKEWEDFAYSHEEKLRYIQRVVDELDADMVRRSTGIDYWQVLKKMYKGMGEKNLENHRKKVSEDLKKFRNTRLYTDYDFEERSWTDANQIDLASSLRSKIMAERMLEYLDYRISELRKE